MRLWFVAIIAMALLPNAASHENHAMPTNHSPSVLAVDWWPKDPGRDMDVAFTAVINTSADPPKQVLLEVCRVQQYSCRSPIPLTQDQASTTYTYFVGDVDWDGRFFAGVTQVGLSLIVVHANDTREESPVADWPQRPAELPPDAGVYYFYALPPEAPEAPGLSGLAALAAIGVALGAWRRWR